MGEPQALDLYGRPKDALEATKDVPDRVQVHRGAKAVAGASDDVAQRARAFGRILPDFKDKLPNRIDERCMFGERGKPFAEGRGGAHEELGGVVGPRGDDVGEAEREERVSATQLGLLKKGPHLP